MNSSFVNDMVCITRFLPVLTVAKFDPSFNVHWLNWLNLILPLILPSFLPSCLNLILPLMCINWETIVRS